MEIPMPFTLEFLEEELLKTLEENELDRSSSQGKLTVYRSRIHGGLFEVNTPCLGPN